MGRNVVSANHLSRIVLSAALPATTGNIPTCGVEERRRHSLKELSDARVSKWKNTLAAKRSQRLEWKANKLACDEEQRQKLDKQEAAARETRRNQLLQRGQRLIYERHERVRDFRTSQHLQDVMATREQQLADALAKKQEEKKMEQEMHLYTMSLLENENKEEESRLMKRHQLNKQIRHDQKAQLFLAKQKELKEMQDLKQEEIELLARLKTEEIDKVAKDLKALLEKKVKAKIEISKIENNKKTQYETKMKQEREENEMREREMQKLIDIASQRALLERKHVAEKQARKKLISDKAAEYFAKRHQEEANSFMKGLQDQQSKEQANLEKREEIRVAQLEQTFRQRAEQLTEKRRALEVAREEELEFLKCTRAKQEAEEIRDHYMEDERNQKDLIVREHQKKQIQENNYKRAAVEKEERKFHNEVAKKQREDDTQFKHFVQLEIQRFKELGKNTDLLERFSER